MLMYEHFLSRNALFRQRRLRRFHRRLHTTLRPKESGSERESRPERIKLVASFRNHTDDE